MVGVLITKDILELRTTKKLNCSLSLKVYLKEYLMLDHRSTTIFLFSFKRCSMLFALAFQKCSYYVDIVLLLGISYTSLK